MSSLSRMAARALGRLPERILAAILPARMGLDPSTVPVPVTAPDAGTRMYIGPANSAGQAWQWARAAERCLDDVGAVSMAAVGTPSFGFPADYPVPLGYYRWSKSWQHAQRNAVATGFTHVIVESGKGLFGDLHPESMARDVATLSRSRVAVALLFHGSDIRLPSRHAATNPWSPFAAGLWNLTQELEGIAFRNAQRVERLGCPAFVSTPDLLLDLPAATWLPVVVDTSAWAADTPPFAHSARPRVAHVPSKAVVKGSDVVDPVLRRLEGEGLLEYVRIEGVAAADMPGHYKNVDIVLDQFRLGSYGVAACEAMAAGRIVVSHVNEQVRNHVSSTTGRELPIVEANPSTLEAVLRNILRQPGEHLRTASDGVDFVASVHDGRLSAEALRDFLRRQAK